MYAGLNLHHDSDSAGKARWYVRVRWFFLLAVALPGIFSNYVGEGLSPQVKRDILLGLIALASNGVFYVLARRKKQASTYFNRLALTILLVDILTITVLIYTKGGIESRSPILYTIPLLISSALFGQKGVYSTAFLSILLYNVLIVTDFTNVIHSIGAVNPELRQNGTYVLNTVTFFTSVLTIISLLADFITRMLSEQQKLAQQNQKSLEEAQRIAKVGSWAWDIETNHIIWSKQLRIMFGLGPEQLHEGLKGYLKYVHPKDMKLINETVEQAMRTGESFAFDHRLVIDGKTKWMHADGQVQTKGGKPVKMFGTAQDITELKNIEEKIRSSSRELQAINNLMVGRELKMIELKRELDDLKKRQR